MSMMDRYDASMDWIGQPAMPEGIVDEAESIGRQRAEVAERDRTIERLRAELADRDAIIEQQRSTIRIHEDTAPRERSTIDYLWAENGRLKQALGVAGPFGQFMTEVFDQVNKSDEVYVDAEAEAKKLAPDIAREMAVKRLTEVMLPNLVQMELAKLDDPAERALMMARIARDPENQKLVAESARLGHDDQMKKAGDEHLAYLMKDAREKPLTRSEIAVAEMRVERDLEGTAEFESMRDQIITGYIETHREEIVDKLLLPSFLFHELRPSNDVGKYLRRDADPAQRRVLAKAIYGRIFSIAWDTALRNGDALVLGNVSAENMDVANTLIRKMIGDLEVEVANDRIERGLPLKLNDLPPGMNIEFQGIVHLSDNAAVRLILAKCVDLSFEVEGLDIANQDLAKLERRNLVKTVRGLVGYEEGRSRLPNLPAASSRGFDSGQWDEDDLLQIKYLALGKLNGYQIDPAKARLQDVLDIKSVRCL